MRLKRVNEEVFYTYSDKVKLDYQVIKGLIDKAGSNRRKRARICMHPDIDHSLHEMIIVHKKSNYEKKTNYNNMCNWFDAGFVRSFRIRKRCGNIND